MDNMHMWHIIPFHSHQCNPDVTSSESENTESFCLIRLSGLRLLPSSSFTSPPCPSTHLFITSLHYCNIWMQMNLNLLFELISLKIQEWSVKGVSCHLHCTDFPRDTNWGHSHKIFSAKPHSKSCIHTFLFIYIFIYSYYYRITDVLISSFNLYHFIYHHTVPISDIVKVWNSYHKVLL